jgi:hypothetical protein
MQKGDIQEREDRPKGRNYPQGPAWVHAILACQVECHDPEPSLYTWIELSQPPIQCVGDFSLLFRQALVLKAPSNPDECIGICLKRDAIEIRRRFRTDDQRNRHRFKERPIQIRIAKV